MRKIIFICISLLSLIPQGFADTGTSTVSRNNNNANCGNTTSHGVIHYGVPNSNNSNAPSSGTVTCTTRAYYASSDYTKSFTYGGGITACGAGERVVSMNSIDRTITCRKFDNISPTSSDITNNNSSNLLANNSYIYTIGISSAGGSPIVSVEGTKENSNNESSTNFADTSYPWSQTWDISKVDNYRTPNGGRQYTFRITKICDEAGNCWTGTKTYTHNVYANTNLGYIGTYSINTTHLTNFTNGTSIADGTTNAFNLTLNDIYSNDIIPASGINRTIDFNFDVNNTLNLDQYRKTGDAVFLSIPSDSSNYANRLTNSSSFNSQPSINGIYSFPFKIYTPTQVAYGKALGNFIIDNITFDVNGTTGIRSGVGISNGNNINFSFNPIYTSTFSGEQKSYGFIEGAIQTGSILVSKNGTVPTSNNNLYIEFGSGITNDVSSSFDLLANLQNGTNYIGEGNNSLDPSRLFRDPFTLDTYNLTTLLTQTGGTVDSYNNQYLSTHISYNITHPNGAGTITPVYNSDIIGKDNYWGSPLSINTMQSGLKVIGATHSQNQKDLTTNQNETDIHILGNITKSSLKRDIRKNAYDLIKSVVHDSGSSSQVINLSGNIWADNNGGKKILNDKIIYYNLTGTQAGGNVELGNGSNLTVGGNKTIIIKGGNLYIKSNMDYSSSSDTLGIIVIKDENGNGGNLYIDPSVKKIVGSIYVDKSILSYNKIYCNPDGEISPNCGGTLEALKNQLYIYGQAFSENTIGGSRSDPLICPYYKYSEPSFTCDLNTAQKYDLNYLRRYFIYDSDENGTINKEDNPYGGYGTSNYFDRNSPYYIYPVVIKYNPMIQITPPPLFSN